MRSLKGTKIRKNISLRKSDWLFGNPVSHGRLPISKTKVAGEILHCKGVMAFLSIEMELKFPAYSTVTLNLVHLDPNSTTFAHRDGGDFGRAQEVRSEPYQCIVSDERRRDRPKGPRPFGVAAGSPPEQRRIACPGNQPGQHDTPCRETSNCNHDVQMWSNSGLVS
jgi:hypothetical protein